MSEESKLKKEQLPQHVAVIMDGNRRWAKSRGFFAIKGHNQGADAVKRLLKYVLEYEIQYITLFGFSAENWQRPKTEVTALMELLKSFINKEQALFHQEEICVRFIGSEQDLSQETISLIRKTEEETKYYSKLMLTIAFNYGARQEITQAVKKIATDIKEDKIQEDDISETLIGNYLYTADLPPLDLLIRTSGEVRLSNFLLWQAAYSELVFQDVLWPDYDKENFLEALSIYTKRTRRFGGN
ncbi:MAG: isoprenyl transferase [Alphaproteobacteria bacterium]